jgi:double-stranded uracil-DNA glycosylase
VPVAGAYRHGVRVLPDVVRPGLTVLFCGLAVGECAALRGHHHAGPGDSFWQLLHQCGLTPRQLRPDEEDLLLDYGLGITDVSDVAGLPATIETLRPRWVAITGKGAASVIARTLGNPAQGLGLASWGLAGADVFVLPSASGANRRKDYDGRSSRTQWWCEFADLVGAPRHRMAQTDRFQG